MINIKVHDLQGVDGTRIYKKIIKDVFVLKLREVFPGVSAPYHNKNWININLQCGRGFWK